MKTVLATAVALVLSWGMLNLTFGCVINLDVTYPRWPNKVVYYIFYPGDYLATEQATIQQAMAQITSDMGGCVNFVQLGSPPASTQGLNYVIISKAGGPGTPSPTCYTYPGMIYNQSGLGQYMSIQNGVNGCLSTVREVMRILMPLLGIRLEYNKPNRTAYINVNTGIATPGQFVTQYRFCTAISVGEFNIYQTGLVLSNAATFDFNSITLLDQPTYSTTGAAVLTSINPASPIYNIGRLSLQDCQCLQYLYSCSNTCQNVYAGLPLPTQFTTTTKTTTPATTTNPLVPVGPDLGR